MFSVIALSQVKKYFATLSMNFARLSNIHLFKFGFGEKSDTIKLYADVASVCKRRMDHYGMEVERYEKIEMETIDNFCTKNNLNTLLA